jgi:hypothetical protein
MIFNLKMLSAAAALVAGSTAYAATVTLTPGAFGVINDPAGSGRSASLMLIQGAGELEFSNGTGVVGGLPVDTVGGLVGALNVAAVVMKPLDGATLTEVDTDIEGDVTRARVKVSATVTSLTADSQTGQFLSVGSKGGAQQIASRIRGVLNGGEMNVSNLRFDLVNKTVIADVAGTPLVYNATTKVWAPGTATSQKDLALWAITSIAGPTQMSVENLMKAEGGDFSGLARDGYQLLAPTAERPYYAIGATNVLGGLRVTDAGFAFFANALGLKAGSTGYNTLAGVNSQPDGWGSITSNMVFTTSIPEPATYALMGLGLVGITLVARRQKSTSVSAA